MFNELLSFQEVSANIDCPVWKAESSALTEQGEDDDTPIETLTQHLLTILNISDSSTGPSYKLSPADLEVSEFYASKKNANKLLKLLLRKYSYETNSDDDKFVVGDDESVSVEDSAEEGGDISALFVKGQLDEEEDCMSEQTEDEEEEEEFEEEESEEESEDDPIVIDIRHSDGDADNELETDVEFDKNQQRRRRRGRLKRKQRRSSSNADEDDVIDITSLRQVTPRRKKIVDSDSDEDDVIDLTAMQQAMPPSSTFSISRVRRKIIVDDDESD